MRKKQREITVDDVKYVWVPGRECCTIYKNRKMIAYWEGGGAITPSMIANKIRESLKAK